MLLVQSVCVYMCERVCAYVCVRVYICGSAGMCECVWGCISMCVACPLSWKTASAFGFTSAQSLLTPGLQGGRAGGGHHNSPGLHSLFLLQPPPLALLSVQWVGLSSEEGSCQGGEGGSERSGRRKRLRPSQARTWCQLCQADGKQNSPCQRQAWERISSQG